MSETIATLGRNQASDLKGRAQELAAVLDEIAEAQERAKEIKAEAKSEGYDMKAFNQVVKELRRGPDYQADMLQLELVLDTYRRGVGLPTELEAAQKLVAEQAGTIPEDEKPGRKAKQRSQEPLN